MSDHLASPGPSKALRALAFVAGFLASSLVLAIIVPSFIRAKGMAQMNAVYNNLRILEGAKDEWKLAHKMLPGDRPALEDLAPYLRNGRLPDSIFGETYQFNALGSNATAVLKASAR